MFVINGGTEEVKQKLRPRILKEVHNHQCGDLSQKTIMVFVKLNKETLFFFFVVFTFVREKI